MFSLIVYLFGFRFEELVVCCLVLLIVLIMCLLNILDELAVLCLGIE